MNKEIEMSKRGDAIYDYLTTKTTRPNNGYLYDRNYDDGSYYESVQTYNYLVSNNNTRSFNRDLIGEFPTFSRRNLPNEQNNEFSIRGTKTTNNYYSKIFSRDDIYENLTYPEISQDPTRNITNSRV